VGDGLLGDGLVGVGDGLVGVVVRDGLGDVGVGDEVGDGVPVGGAGWGLCDAAGLGTGSMGRTIPCCCFLGSSEVIGSTGVGRRVRTRDVPICPKV
jgi:hypothetical protein